MLLCWKTTTHQFTGFSSLSSGINLCTLELAPQVRNKCSQSTSTQSVSAVCYGGLGCVLQRWVKCGIHHSLQVPSLNQSVSNAVSFGQLAALIYIFGPIRSSTWCHVTNQSYWSMLSSAQPCCAGLVQGRTNLCQQGCINQKIQAITIISTNCRKRKRTYCNIMKDKANKVYYQNQNLQYFVISTDILSLIQFVVFRTIKGASMIILYVSCINYCQVYYSNCH